MPRIHYPKGIGTSRVRGPKWPGGCRIPRRGCPFFTKAHETLTRRPGESCVSVPRVRRRPAHHRPNRSRRGGSHRSRASQVASSSESGSGDTVPEGLRLRGSSRGCFQRGTSVVKALPPRVPGRCQPPRTRFDCRSVHVTPAHVSAGLPKVCGSLNPGPLVFQDSSGTQYASRNPRPTTSQAYEGFGGPSRHPIHEVVGSVVRALLGLVVGSSLSWGPRLILRGCPVRSGPHVLAEPPS